MNLTRKCLALAICLLSVGLTSCEDPIKAPGGARLDPLHPNAYPQIVSLDGLEAYLGWDGPIVSRDGVLKITAPVRAVTSYEDLNVQYRFVFFDKDGRPFDTEPIWRFKRLPSRTQVFIEGSALDGRAVDWRLEVRPAR